MARGPAPTRSAHSTSERPLLGAERGVPPNARHNHLPSHPQPHLYHNHSITSALPPLGSSTLFHQGLDQWVHSSFQFPHDHDLCIAAGPPTFGDHRELHSLYDFPETAASVATCTRSLPDLLDPGSTPISAGNRQLT